MALEAAGPRRDGGVHVYGDGRTGRTKKRIPQGGSKIRR